ncbi:MAG: hypothetical protein H0W78_20030 [Planctomycetes bacterium]|jgi:hypothetical protein|nr:hypothetical protein [Planctomycetota bacterium]
MTPVQRSLSVFFLLVAGGLCGVVALRAADPIIVPLWPDLKGDPTWGEELIVERTKAAHSDRSLRNVTRPLLTVVESDRFEQDRRRISVFRSVTSARVHVSSAANRLAGITP